MGVDAIIADSFQSCVCCHTLSLRKVYGRSPRGFVSSLLSEAEGAHRPAGQGGIRSFSLLEVWMTGRTFP